MFKIKVNPEEFYVKEILDIEAQSKGNYALYLLKKINRNTIDVVREIAKRFSIPVKNIGFAGLKDKNAYTEQYISIKAFKNLPEIIEGENYRLELIGFIDKPLELGKFAGNYFEIIVRNLSRRERKNAERNKDFIAKYGLANYFGEQRFGSIKMLKNL